MAISKSPPDKSIPYRGELCAETFPLPRMGLIIDSAPQILVVLRPLPYGLPGDSLRQSNGSYSVLPEGSLMQDLSFFGASPFHFCLLCIAAAQLLMTKRVLYLNEAILLFSKSRVNHFFRPHPSSGSFKRRCLIAYPCSSKAPVPLFVSGLCNLSWQKRVSFKKWNLFPLRRGVM